MKIIYIANARLPTEKAHGIQIMKTCEALVLAGVEVELFMPRRFNWIKKDPFEYYGIEKRFKIRKFLCLDLIPLDRYIGHLGLWIESITFFLSVFPHILFERTDTIYTRDKFSFPFSFLKKSFFFEAHTFPKNYFLYSLFLKRLKGIIVITQELKKAFERRGINPNKILVSPDGVDLEKFNISTTQEECRRKLNLPSDKKIILYTGHLYKWKGAQILAESAKHLSPEVLIVFVGGTERDINKFKIQNSSIDNILIIGHRPHSEIPYWLKAADVLVLPNSAKENISKHWTSPLKMFEYMAAKRPIIASNLPSVREVLNKNNALLVEPDNVEELIKGIKNALNAPDFFDRISNQAFQDVQDYTWHKRAKNILKFIS